jgi:hypothetical protein
VFFVIHLGQEGADPLVRVSTALSRCQCGFFAFVKAHVSCVVHVIFSRESLSAVSWSKGSMMVARLGVAIRSVL